MAYFESDLEYYLRYVESLRRNPEWSAATINSTWYGDWIQSTPRYLAMRTPFHSTASRSRLRPMLGDSAHTDDNGPSYLMARIADELDSGVAQREAWYGHNAATYGSTTTRRDVLDVLWFDDQLSPKTNHAF